MSQESRVESQEQEMDADRAEALLDEYIALRHAEERQRDERILTEQWRQVRVAAAARIMAAMLGRPSFNSYSPAGLAERAVYYVGLIERAAWGAGGGDEG